MESGSNNTVSTPPPEPEMEKRRDLRVPLRVLKVETELKGDVFFGYATNISSNGLFIETTNPKDTGLKVKVSFDLPVKKIRIVAIAEVMWTQEYSGERGPKPGMGLKFTEISAEHAKAILEFVEQQQA